ncbi:MAG: recombination-associated protein RdgC [Lentisphaerae bacterium]|nr:recombination-associated protein RdgC [Lentisphaerota bacterium]MCP4103553.1 recombination-associated protein RdgC [Lentisphaerota bacterium]
MPFDRGSVTVTIFELPEKLPENIIELFAAKKSGMLDAVKDEPQIGWVSGRTLLETNIDDETAYRGGCIFLHYRKAERKIPSSLMNAICQREELVYMRANETDMVPTKIRREIKEEATEKHLMKMPPSLSGIPLIIDIAAKLLYVGTGSVAQLDNFIALFYKTTNIEPFQLTPGMMLETMYQDTKNDLPGVNFSDVQDEIVPGRDFLTWLWYFSEMEGGGVSHEQFGDFDIMIEAPLTFAFAADARGSAETVVKKGGSPLRAAESKAALQVGKRLKKAKITICRGDDIWSGTFDADNFSFGSLNLPEGEEMDKDSRFAERIQNLFIFQNALREYFKKFVETVRDVEWPNTERRIKQWASERESF